MTSARRREELQLLEDLVPISEEHEQAKAEYREALESGDPQRIRAAKARKQEAARRLRETRFWLRAEDRARRLAAELERAERHGDKGQAAQVRAELERWEQRLTPIREGLAVLAAQKGGN